MEAAKASVCQAQTETESFSDCSATYPSVRQILRYCALAHSVLAWEGSPL